MYADETELGWDPTMQRQSPREYVGDVQYTIECDGVTYRTVRLISDIGAEAIRGRGTRVWEVREVKKNGGEDPTPLALKDSWVDTNREREGKILESIRLAAKKLPGGSDFDQLFMQAKAYGDVYIDNVQDNTHLLIRRRDSLEGMLDEPPLLIKAGPPKPPNINSNVGTKGAPQVPNDDEPELVEYSAKIHHRIVFTEVGTTIAEVNSLAAAMIAMVDIVKGECLIPQAASSYLMAVRSFGDSPSMRMGAP